MKSGDDLIKFYENKKESYGDNPYRNISNMLKEVKILHHNDFTGLDHGQSWRSFKGKNFEKLIEHIIVEEVHGLGLEMINGNHLGGTKGKGLSKELQKVRSNLLIDYGEFGKHLPDVDLVIYHPTTCKVIAIISCKITLRERISQTGYWKLKLHNQSATKHIRVYFITLDEDKTLGAVEEGKHYKKARAIVEMDVDGSYIMTENNVAETVKVKKFDKFIDDLKELLKQ